MTRREAYKEVRDSLIRNVSCKFTKNCTFHSPRPLDEAAYPSLCEEDLAVRNSDQVVSSVSGSSARCILMVPQLWLWKIDNVIIMASSMIPDSCRLRHRRRLNVHDDLLLVVGEMLASLVAGFGHECVVEDVTYPPYLTIFETSVVMILAEVSKYMGKSGLNPSIT